MRRYLCSLAFALFLFGCAVDDVPIEPTSAAIVDGTVDLSYPAVVFLFNVSGGACTGTIVAPRVGPVEEVFEDGRHALLVEPGDPDSIRSAIEKLASSADERARLGAEARRHFDANYSWERNADRTVRILAEAKRE